MDADTITGEMHPIRRAVISIGSNVGERRVNLQGAVDSLADTPEVWVTAVSSVYETAPVESPEGSKDFLNAIVLLDTTLSARTLLERALAVEAAYGRERTGERNEPRTLDVDLIVVGRPPRRRGRPEPAAPAGRRACVRAGAVARARAARPRSPARAWSSELLEKTGREGVTLREDIELEFH